MDDNMKHAKIRVWLPVLMYCALASLINSVVSYLPFIPASLTTWISRTLDKLNSMEQAADRGIESLKQQLDELIVKA